MDYGQEEILNIINNSLKAQSKITTIYGPNGTKETFNDKMPKNGFKKLESLSIYDGDNLEAFLPPEVEIYISSQNNKSYYFDGLCNNKVTFNGKINHIIIRSCKNSTFNLNDGCVSGIDILSGNNIELYSKIHNFTSLENSSDVNINGEYEDYTILSGKNCIDVKFNNISLHLGAFIHKIFRF